MCYSLGVWPPVPDSNYRYVIDYAFYLDTVAELWPSSKGHYIVSEYVDKVLNKHCPTYPWEVSPSLFTIFHITDIITSMLYVASSLFR
jgi:hypothetical protein